MHLLQEFIIRVDSSIKSIQNAFNEAFPYLKIEFFVNDADGKERRFEPVAPSGSLRYFLKGKEQLDFSISSSITVLELEQFFNDNFGLAIQVCRKAGSVWVETLLTSHWSLEQQNEEGKQFSEPGGNLPTIKKGGRSTSFHSK